MKSTVDAIGFAVCLFAAGCVAVHCYGCGPSEAPKAAQAAAEGAYGAALLKCVDDAKTLPESKACRARVDASFGVTQAGKDAGQ